MQLRSYVQGRWQAGERNAAAAARCDDGRRDRRGFHRAASTSRAVLDYARRVGGPALRELTFHERARMLKALAEALTERKEEFYALSYATGATKSDSLDRHRRRHRHARSSMRARAARELPDEPRATSTATSKRSRRAARSSASTSACRSKASPCTSMRSTSRCGACSRSWRPTLLAGVPAIVKPATPTCLSHGARRSATSSSPASCRKARCSSSAAASGDLFDHLDLPGRRLVHRLGQRRRAKLRTHPNVIAQVGALHRGDRFAQLLACSGPTRRRTRRSSISSSSEVAREMTVKAGQKCTAIRSAIVPARASRDVVDRRCRARLRKIVVGDPRLRASAHGAARQPRAARRRARAAIAELAARRAARRRRSCDAFELAARIARRARSCRRCCCYCRDTAAGATPSTKSRRSARSAPSCRIDDRRRRHRARPSRQGQPGRLGVHRRRRDRRATRAGPGAVPRPHAGHRIATARRNRPATARRSRTSCTAARAAPAAARRWAAFAASCTTCSARRCRALRDVIARVTGRWIARRDAERRPACIRSASRSTISRSATRSTPASAQVTLDDIERFAELSRRSLLRAHGRGRGGAQSVLRRPRRARLLPRLRRGRSVRRSGVRPGARELRPRQSALRQAGEARRPHQGAPHLQGKDRCAPSKGYGEVRWDTEITNQRGETVATYDVLTMVSELEIPDSAPARPA